MDPAAGPAGPPSHRGRGADGDSGPLPGPLCGRGAGADSAGHGGYGPVGQRFLPGNRRPTGPAGGPADSDQDERRHAADSPRRPPAHPEVPAGGPAPRPDAPALAGGGLRGGLAVLPPPYRPGLRAGPRRQPVPPEPVRLHRQAGGEVLRLLGGVPRDLPALLPGPQLLLQPVLPGVQPAVPGGVPGGPAEQAAPPGPGPGHHPLRLAQRAALQPVPGRYVYLYDERVRGAHRRLL